MITVRNLITTRIIFCVGNFKRHVVDLSSEICVLLSIPLEIHRYSHRPRLAFLSIDVVAARVLSAVRFTVRLQYDELLNIIEEIRLL